MGKKIFVWLLCLVVVGLWGCGRAEVEPYSDAIIAYLALPPASDLYAGAEHYALCDIDNDGTEELLFGKEYVNDEIRLYTIYAKKNGKLVRQKQFGTIGEGGSICQTSLFKNGTVRVDRVDDEVEFYYYYFRFSGGRLKLQLLLLDNTYFIDNDYYDFTEAQIPITKEEFDRLRKEFEGDGQVVELDWKPLAEYGR